MKKEKTRGSEETSDIPKHLIRMRWQGLGLIVALCGLLAAHPIAAGENLRLAAGLSFTDDSSAAFPVEGDRLGEAEFGHGRAAVAFFGASHCWNTNREAERLVALYPRFRDRVSFIIVDVEHPSDAQRALLAAHYHGSIPTIVVFAPNGAVLDSQPGETASKRGDTHALEALLDRAVGK